MPPVIGCTGGYDSVQLEWDDGLVGRFDAERLGASSVWLSRACEHRLRVLGAEFKRNEPSSAVRDQFEFHDAVCRPGERVRSMFTAESDRARIRSLRKANVVRHSAG